MNIDVIPEILKAKPNWVVWGVPGELPKIPFNPDSLIRLKPVPAKSGIPETWGSFYDATKCVFIGLAKGIGYEFDGGNIYGIDLDNVISGSSIKPDALEVVERLESYTEISPSGKGLHVFVIADDVSITRHRKQGGFVEIYNDRRYFTVTGNVLEGYTEIADRTKELQAVHDKHLMPIVESKMPTGQPVMQQGFDYMQRGLEKDPVLRGCWHGCHRRGDESASDQALMNKLAYWCCADQGAMIAAFMRSPYYSQKGEVHKKKCGRHDYLPNTAKVACATLRSTAHEDTIRYQRSRSRNEAR